MGSFSAQWCHRERPLTQKDASHGKTPNTKRRLSRKDFLDCLGIPPKDWAIRTLFYLSVVSFPGTSLAVPSATIWIQPHPHKRGALLRAVYHERERQFISTWCKHPIEAFKCSFILNIQIFFKLKLIKNIRLIAKILPLLLQILMQSIWRTVFWLSLL